MKADEFKVGDEVYCFFNKKGKCIRIEYDRRTYPVIIRFETGKVLSYTSSGKCEINGVRTLFFEEIIIPESAYKRPRWRAESGGEYFLVGSSGDIYSTRDNYYEIDDLHFKTKNYFVSKQEARESKFYKVFHEEE